MGECNEWAASDTYKFTQNGNVYTLSLPSLTGKFKIASADWKTINYGADGMNGKDVLQNNVEAPAYWDSSVDFSVADELTDVVITFTYNEGHTQASTIKVSGTVGLQSVDYADGVVRVNGGVISVDGCDDYSVYTTSGVLVSRNAEASVAPGFYLAVINGKAVKVVVK